jgi:hypothetical protein
VASVKTEQELVCQQEWHGGEMACSINVERFEIRSATQSDVPIILSFIKKLADYERLSHEVIATEESLRQTLFGPQPIAEVAIGYCKEEPVGFFCSLIIIRHSLGGLESTSKTYLSTKRTASGVLAARYCSTWRAWPKSAAAVGSNGRCWTGMSRQSISTKI